MMFAGAFLVERLQSIPPERCPYCQAFKRIPCALHRAAGPGEGP